MFAVKSEYCVQPSRDVTIPFYVAGNNVYFKRADIANAVYGSLFGVVIFSSFENYDGDFASFIECRNLFLEQPQRFMNRDFWRDIFNQDYSKVIAEVRDAQHFVKEYFRLDLPEEWYRYCLNVDAVIANLPVKATEWIEKCHNSLRILATNDEQKQAARRVYDKAWKILKAREKDANADKRPTVHDTSCSSAWSADLSNKRADFMKYPEAEHLVHKLELQAALLNLEADCYLFKAQDLQQKVAANRKQADELKDKINQIWEESD